MALEKTRAERAAKAAQQKYQTLCGVQPAGNTMSSSALPPQLTLMNYSESDKLWKSKKSSKLNKKSKKFDDE